jgi:hypothetical protein
MSKKTKIVYIYLTLFAFTLGFSFTTRVNANSDPQVEPCCVITWCATDPDQPEHQGHWVEGTYWVCVDTESGHRCDIWTICSNSDPGVPQ